MCLSSVYAVGGPDKELLCKNVSSVRMEDGKLVCTDILGSRTEVEGEIERIDLIDNFSYIRKSAN